MKYSASAAVPGPGTYDPKAQGKCAPRGLVVPRRPDSAPACGRGTPGPGAYEHVLAHKRAAPKYGMGTGDARGRPNKDTMKFPGPNCYSQSRNLVLRKSPSWAIGTSQRKPITSRTGYPGPGTYSETKALNKTISVRNFDRVI